MPTPPEACIVCNRGAPFPPLHSEGRHTLVRCRECRLVFQHPQPDDAALAGTYYFAEEWTALITGDMSAELAERATMLLGRVHARGIRPPGRVLDVGAAAGAFVREAGRAGWRATGVEIGPSNAAAARREGLDVRTGTLPAVADSLDRGTFDLVTFWDVLEHLRDPREELRLAWELLRPGGALAATMPNVEGLYPRATYRLFARPKGLWEHPELPEHTFDFSPATLRRLLEDQGWVDVWITTQETPFAFYRSTKLSMDTLGRTLRGRAAIYAFEALRAVLYPLARRMDRANAMFVTARRPG